MTLNEEQYKQLLKDVTKVIAETLNTKIDIVTNNKLQQWFDTNIAKQVDVEIKKQFRKMLVIKFGE